MFECTRVRYTAVVLEYVYGRTKFSSMNPWATHDHMMHGHMQFARHSNTLIVTKKFENYWLMLNFENSGTISMQKRGQNVHGSVGLAPGIEPQLMLAKIVHCGALTTWPRWHFD